MSDNIDRVKNVAFWHWEYLRRNPDYYNYSMFLENLFFDLVELGVESFFPLPTNPDEYLSSKDRVPFETEICRRFGKRASLLYYKFKVLNEKFEVKMGHPYQDRLEGLDTDKALKQLIDGEDINFMSDDPDDILALLHLHQDWSITVNNAPPNIFNMFSPLDSISIIPETLDKPNDTVALEYKALKIVDPEKLSSL